MFGALTFPWEFAFRLRPVGEERRKASRRFPQVRVSEAEARAAKSKGSRWLRQQPDEGFKMCEAHLNS